MQLIQHKIYNSSNPKPLTWYRGTLDNQSVVFLICECGRKAPLDITHTIKSNGIVSPSVW